MSDVRDWLKEGDPVAIEPPLPDADLQRMRRAIVAEAERAQPLETRWWRPVAIVAIAMALAVAVGMNRWSTPADRAAGALMEGPVSTAAISDGVTRRQVQWIAPGGTRVIWILNADFQP